MLRILCCTACGLTLAVAGLPAAGVSAQEGVLSHFYGSGVHNFYERDYFQAMSNLSAAIDGGSQDPRAYYYRALANMRTGNSGAAQRDLQKGAELESADVDQFYRVGKALERVQGSERMMIERYRALARAQARQRQMKRDAVRYEQRRQSEAQVLRNVPLGAPPAPLRPAPAAPAAAVEPPQPAAAPAAPAETTPFDSPPAAAPAEDSPFDAPAAEDSPFGEPAADEAPATDDPFGTPEGGAEMEAPAADADPFSDEP